MGQERDNVSDIRHRVNQNIEKIQETFEMVFCKKQMTVDRFMVRKEE